MARDFTNAKTSVFWDVEDFPVPPGLSFYEIIKLALENEGYRGDVSITAYGEKKPEDDLDGVIAFVPKRGKFWRLNRMLFDIGFWAMDNPHPGYVPTNLMVISKNIQEETEFVDLLQTLKSIGYNVLLVVPDNCVPEQVPIPSVAKAWIWGSLLDGGKPIHRSLLASLVARGLREISPDVDDDTLICPICGCC